MQMSYSPERMLGPQELLLKDSCEGTKSGSWETKTVLYIQIVCAYNCWAIFLERIGKYSPAWLTAFTAFYFNKHLVSIFYICF